MWLLYNSGKPTTSLPAGSRQHHDRDHDRDHDHDRDRDHDHDHDRDRDRDRETIVTSCPLPVGTTDSFANVLLLFSLSTFPKR